MVTQLPLSRTVNLSTIYPQPPQSYPQLIHRFSTSYPQAGTATTTVTFPVDVRGSGTFVLYSSAAPGHSFPTPLPRFHHRLTCIAGLHLRPSTPRNPCCLNQNEITRPAFNPCSITPLCNTVSLIRGISKTAKQRLAQFCADL